MTLTPDGRPLFVDPVSLGASDDVDDAPIPRWFLLVALTIAVVAIYYLAAFFTGPRLSSPHDFETGRSTYENATQSG